MQLIFIKSLLVLVEIGTYRLKNTAESGHNILTEQFQIGSSDVLDDAVDQIQHWQFHLCSDLNTKNSLYAAQVVLADIFFMQQIHFLSAFKSQLLLLFHFYTFYTYAYFNNDVMHIITFKLFLEKCLVKKQQTELC